MNTATQKASTAPSRRPIQQLSTSMINKIAAGEVIERPASVVKELLENSVDAGATQIEVALEKGGIELIRITDNGSGIPEDQLSLAVTSHATSKISTADDLFSVGTFGFRGEALASITEVSQTTIRSRTPDSDCGFELVVNGGHHEPVQPCGCPIGTTIEVRQLFYNTPVRQKFMKTPQTERGHIAEAFTRVALANPHVQMTLTHNGKVLHQLSASDSWAQRIAQFFGPEIGENLIPVSNEGEEISISGFVVNPSVSRSNNKLQYLFLNDRFIRDRSLQHALSEAYRGLLMVGRFPICFLQMKMPFDMVDVNVHPAKLEVRFQNGGAVYRQLLSTLRSKFLSTDLTAKGSLGRHNSSVGPVADAETSTATDLTLQSGPSENQERIPFAPTAVGRDWTSAPRPANQPSVPGQANSFRPFPPLVVGAPGQVNIDSSPKVTRALPSNYDPFSQPMPNSENRGADSSALANQPTANQPTANQPTAGQWTAEDVWADAATNVARPDGLEDSALSNGAPSSSKVPLAIQVHNTYLVHETAEGMIITDQHALHERIIYEQIRQKVLAGTLEKQKLLVPEPVTLRPTEAASVLEQTELLRNLGIEVEPFGGDTVLVASYPAMLSNQNPAEVLKSVIEKLMGDAKNLDQRDLVDELLHMISCKAAIKAGDKLTPEEIEALLEQRELCQDGHHCPHGRPTSLTFSREELDKKFKRI